MSVSLYYMAKRDYPISKEEQEACMKAVERYIEEYPFGEMYESFCVYDMNDPSEKDVIFEGATKLPLDEGEEHLAEVFDYWEECLQKIIEILPNAHWDIRIEDIDVTSHFRYPE